MFCSVGVHPHEAAHEPDVAAERLVELAKHPEGGRHRREPGSTTITTRARASSSGEVFRAHIEAARADRPAADRAQPRRRRRHGGAAAGRARTKGGAARASSIASPRRQYLADAALEIGFFISLSGIVTFKNAEELRAGREDRAAGPAAGRDRLALPGAGADARQAQRADLRRAHRDLRRRAARHGVDRAGGGAPPPISSRLFAKARPAPA